MIETLISHRPLFQEKFPTSSKRPEILKLVQVDNLTVNVSQLRIRGGYVFRGVCLLKQGGGDIPVPGSVPDLWDWGTPELVAPQAVCLLRFLAGGLSCLKNLQVLQIDQEVLSPLHVS